MAKDNRIDIKLFLFPNVTIEWDTPSIFRKMRGWRLFTHYSTKKEEEKEWDQRLKDLEDLARQVNRQAKQDAQEADFMAAQASKDTGTMRRSWPEEAPPKRSDVERFVSLVYDGSDGWEVGLVDTEDNVLYIGPLESNMEPIPLKAGSCSMSGFWLKSPDGHTEFKLFDGGTRYFNKGDTLEITYDPSIEKDGERRGRVFLMKFEMAGA